MLSEQTNCESPRSSSDSLTEPGSPIYAEPDRASLILLKTGDTLEEGEEENNDRSGLLVNKVRAFVRANK